MKALGILSRVHARLGDFWWYSILMFAALRFGDVINAFVGLWLVPKYVNPEELGAVLPLIQFSAFVGYPMAVLVTVFSRYLAKFRAEGDEGRIKSALHWFIGSAIAFNALACGLSIFAMPHFFERIRVAKGSLGALIILAGLLGPLSLVYTRALQGLKKFGAITFINLLSAPIRLGVMLVTLPIRALSGYMLGQAAAPAFCIATACFALRRNVRPAVKSVPFWLGQGREIARYFSAVFLSLSVGSVSAFIMPLLIRQRLPEVESAAYYMITRFAELGTYASTTLSFVMFPLASEAHATGKDPLKLFLHTAAGSLGFGVLVSLALCLFGDFIFNLLPTCRPYVSFVPDMALLTLSLALGAACGTFTDYEFACSRFRFLWWNLPLTVLQTAFAVAFTGYEFFRGCLPDATVDWMASLHVATLRNFIWMLIAASLVRLVAILLHLACRAHASRHAPSAA